MTEEARHIKPDASPNEHNKSGAKTLFWLRRVFYRLWRLSAELGAVIMGVAIVWLFALSWFLSQQSLDISSARGILGQLFTETVAGAGVEIPSMRLDWYPANDDIVFTGQDIIINANDGTDLQNFASLQSYFPLKDVRHGNLIPRKVVLTGGVVSWVEDENGRIRAGLGTPDNLGRLGPLWEGRRATSRRRATLDLDGVDTVEINEARAYYINSTNGLAASLNDVALNFERQAEILNLSLAANLAQPETDDQIPLLLSISTNTEFDNFDVFLRAEGLNPSVSGPTKGRYAQVRDLNAPVTLDTNFLYGPESGLASADLDIKIGAGKFGRADLPREFEFDSIVTSAVLNAGDAEMTVSQLDVTAPLLRFESSGSLTELDAINDGDINSSPFFDLNFQKLFLDARPVFEERLNFNGLDIAGRLDVDAQTLHMETLTLDRGSHKWIASVFLDRDEQGQFEAIKAEGAVQGPLTGPELLEVWPVKFADGARRWLVRSVEAGVIDSLSFEADLERTNDGELIEKVMDMDFTVQDGTVKYISTMTPLTNASGFAKISDNRLDFTLEEGEIGNLSILPSQVQIPRLKPKGGDMVITINAVGGASEMLGLLNQPPFQLADRYDTNPKEVSGQGSVNVKITRPLLEYFDQNRILYEINGDFTDVAAPFKVGNYQLTNGDVSLNVDQAGLQVKGPVNIGPWQTNMEWSETFDEGLTPSQYHLSGQMTPDVLDKMGVGFREYVDGTAQVDIRATGTGADIKSAIILADLEETEISIGEYWNKPKGEPGSLSASVARSENSIDISAFELSAPELDVKGQLAFRSDFALRELVFETFKVSDLVDAKLVMKPDEEREVLSANLDGALLNISSILDRSLSTRTSALDVPLSLSATLDELILDPEFTTTQATLFYAHSGQAMTQLDLSADTEAGPLSVSLETDQPNKVRTVQASFPDASQAANAFLGINSLQGGVFTMTGNLPLPNEEGNFVGWVGVTNFKVKEAPILAQLLSLGSLTGLFNTLSGEGLAFENFELPFQLSDGVLTVRDARVYGPALGMTGAGNIDLKNETVDLDGALVPAYTANSLLGDLPLIGDLLVGKEGEGIFALSYQVAGPFEATQITVNPLSALTPGFLRGIFRKQRDDLPEVERLMEEAGEVAPPAE